MKKLSLAAQGQRRGVLEILKEPPALFTDMETSGDSSNSTANTYSIVSLVFFIGMMVSGIGIPGLMAGVYLMGIVLSLGMFGTTLYSSLSYEDETIFRRGKSKKEKALYGIRNAAEKAVNGEEFSLSYSIAESVYWWNDLGPAYVENLTPRQKRWVAKQWKRQLIEATEGKKNGYVPGGIADVDNIVDPKQIKNITLSLDELEKLRNSSMPIDNFTDFDRELKRLSS